MLHFIKSAEEFKRLKLPEEHLDKLFENSPKDVLKVISKVIAVVLRKQNVPENEIQLIKLVCKKIVKGRSPGKIAEELEENENHIRMIYDTALKFAPDYDAEKIFNSLPKKNLVN